MHKNSRDCADVAVVVLKVVDGIIKCKKPGEGIMDIFINFSIKVD